MMGTNLNTDYFSTPWHSTEILKEQSPPVVEEMYVKTYRDE